VMNRRHVMHPQGGVVVDRGCRCSTLVLLKCVAASYRANLPLLAPAFMQAVYHP
jgi:hypothetical protein